ncbi:tRNA pseudouridine(55) synthase TruB [Glaciecola sp. 2405UD65-10]|uniref:tRNA pseudouridine(55) synthase TruB n=1 Tax=Glaciecola sp. 2405UD65-10 TaxID=3397244 RepID=UPI003B5C98F8
MGRKRKGRAINGVLIVDKPQGISSNDVVQRVKRIYKAQKAGHTGALDPLATGLLPVCLGEATKFSQFLLDADKSYFVSAILGERTDTSDADGEIVETKPVNVTESDIRAALGQFRGQIKQVPSMFSALKHEGKPLYYYARQGITIERPARDITIYDIEWVSLENNVLSLNVQCSKGTYIRSLIDDLGQLLGCGAHVSVLRRTEVAHYKSAQMYTFEQLESLQEEDKFSPLDDILLPMDTAIASLTKRVVSEEEAIQFCLGQAVSSIDLSSPRLNEGEVVRLYEETTQRFLGVATVNEMNLLQPKRVVVYASDTLEA